MFVVCVTIHVKPQFRDKFIEATYANAANTRKENGNIRFDVLQCEDDDCRFMLYEVYHTREDFAAHQQTAHYATWKATVADWMAQPRQGIRHRALFFGDGKVQQ